MESHFTPEYRQNNFEQGMSGEASVKVEDVKDVLDLKVDQLLAKGFLGNYFPFATSPRANLARGKRQSQRYIGITSDTLSTFSTPENLDKSPI